MSTLSIYEFHLRLSATLREQSNALNMGRFDVVRSVNRALEQVIGTVLVQLRTQLG